MIGPVRLTFAPLIALVALIVTTCTYGQASTDSSSVRRFEYTRIDEIHKSHNPVFGSKKGTIRLSLTQIRNLDTDTVVMGVEVQIAKSQQEVTSMSLALAGIGSLWGRSVSATVQNIRKQGFIFLDHNEVADVIVFLNGIIGAIGKEQPKWILYKISLSSGFELGMLYNPDLPGIGLSKWRFVFTADDTSYELNYEDGIEVLRSLDAWVKHMRTSAH